MHPVLAISKRSPFARRVRILMTELGLPFELEIFDVFNPTAKLLSMSPMGRVPALLLPSGQRIADSSSICAYLRETQGHHDLFQVGATPFARHCHATGLALGVMECVVQYFMETLRPDGQASPSDKEELLRMIHRGLSALSDEFAEMPGGGAWFFGETFRAVDCSVGAALEYAEFRVGPHVLDSYPKLKRLLHSYLKRESFAQSRPS
jgi:glutathione S-transferase